MLAATDAEYRAGALAPAKLRELAGNRVTARVPLPYQKEIVSCLLGSKIVYNEGLAFVEGLSDAALAGIALRYLREERKVEALVDKVRRADAPHSLRLHKKRVYYVRDEVMRRATSVGREQLVALGTCLGKFTHSDKFRLTIGALDVLAAHAKYKMWVKPTSEMGFMYGNHLLKSGLGRISENTPANAGVVIYSMADVPVGFGVAAKSTQDCRKLDPSAIVAYHLADVGEYLRAEDAFVSGKKD